MADERWLHDLNDDPDLKQEDDIDALIRSTKEELSRGEARQGGNPGPPVNRQPPAPKPVKPFEPKIPEIYADLTVDDEDDGEDEEPERRLASGWRVLIYVVSVLLASVLLALIAWQCADDVLALTKPDRNVGITVTADDDIDSVTDKLKEAGLIEYPWLFRFYCWFSHAEEKIDVGSYELNNRYDYHALVNGMRGTTNRATTTVTIPEGYTCEQIFTLLEEKGVCAASDLYEAAANTEFDFEFLKGLPYGEDNRLEGYLFPDTYDFYVSKDVHAVPGEEADRVLLKFLNNYERRFDETLQSSIADLNDWLREKMTAAGFTEAEIQESMMDAHKVLIVASLIEKESSSTAESDTISSVIYNRLCSKDYPLLEIDASVLYALGEHKEVLTAQDLMVDSPYNTRRYPGLPVGPIANPGLASIRAALYPEDTDYYFYALDVNGSHHFSRTYWEHNQFLEEQASQQ